MGAILERRDHNFRNDSPRLGRGTREITLLLNDEHLNAIMIQNDVLSTAKFEGWEEGRAEERLETARRMRSDGLSMEMVVRYTGLSEEEINNL